MRASEKRSPLVDYSNFFKKLNCYKIRNSWMEDKHDKPSRVPVIDLSQCTDCESCLEICPAVFKRNEETGIIEVVELPEYPEKDILEAMSMCPADCITWEHLEDKERR